MSTPIAGGAHSAKSLPGDGDDLAERSRKREFWRRFLGDKLVLGALILFLVMVALAAFAPWVAPHEPNKIDLTNRFAGTSMSHWLGTDDLGRDVLSRLIFASRVSLGGAFMAVAVAAVLGVPAGLLAGYLGGRWDWWLSRVADALMTLPTLVLALAIIAAMGPGLTRAMLALGIAYAPRAFRVARAATLSVREETYVAASITIGTPARTILLRRVLPNTLSPIIIQLSLMVSFAILAEASLSFLGLGVQLPQASWGGMLSQAFRDIRRAPLLIYWPGAAIALTAIALNIVGDGLRDAVGREIRHFDEQS